MTKPAPCQVFTYIHRVNPHGGARSVGWKCACGAESSKRNHPSREAALKDAERHQEET